MRWALAFFAMAIVSSPLGARADCTQDYVVQPGDSFYTIAERELGDRSQWSAIYYANQTAGLGTAVLPGNVIQIPCRSSPALAPVLQPTPDAELTLLTGAGMAPFTDPSLPGQGLITEVVRAALDRAPHRVSHAIRWEDDWSQHLGPLSGGKTADMGFPWVKPDCTATPDAQLCREFLFSEPLTMLPIMLFVRAEASMVFTNDADLSGRTLCRPEGHFVHDLDRNGRNLVSSGTVSLVTAATLEMCLRRVMDGAVDAVSVSLFDGAESVVRAGLRGQIVPLERPVSTVGLHAIIAKTHWRGTVHLYRVNEGLRRLKASGDYRQIVDRHISGFRARLN